MSLVVIIFTILIIGLPAGAWAYQVLHSGDASPKRRKLAKWIWNRVVTVFVAIAVILLISGVLFSIHLTDAPGR